jgi:F-type H+-transporting ATPase subunit epsilon
MQKTIKFEIVTPERVVLREDITQVSVPTKQGEITVLANHIPLIASLQAGVIHIKKSDGNEDVMSVSGGFIEVLKDKVVILADTAERAEELDESRITEAQKRAEDNLKDMRDFDRDRFANISAALAKEMARSRAQQRWKKIKRIEK